MAEHFRDFQDPQIDTFAAAVLEPEHDLLHKGLVKHGAAILTRLGGERLRDSSDGQRWSFTGSSGHQAVMEVLDPDRFIPALIRYRDVGLFYGYSGGEESLWRPDTGSTHIPEEVDTGNPESDSLVPIGEALYLSTRVPRGLGRLAASVAAPLRDSIAQRRWDPSLDRTKVEIAAHYDLSPDVYTGPYGFLDDRFVQYSSGVLPPGQEFVSLEDLQHHKVEALARKLELENAGTLLEIGGGWGGLAVALAQAAPNLHITSLTVSDEQLTLARQRAEAAGVADRIDFLGKDYRELEVAEPFDRVVSVEMIEAVDWRDLDTYFDALANFADPDTGVIVLQSINIKPEQFASQRHNKNFANTAIFPGGVLTPKEVIKAGMNRRGMLAYEETDISSSYALTLREWRRNLCHHRPALTEKWLRDGVRIAQIERFYRGFSLYLALSETGIRPETGNIQGSQLTFRPAHTALRDRQR